MCLHLCAGAITSGELEPLKSFHMLTWGPLHTTKQLALPMEHREDMAITDDYAPTSSQTEPTPTLMMKQSRQCTDPKMDFVDEVHLFKWNYVHKFIAVNFQVLIRSLFALEIGCNYNG